MALTVEDAADILDKLPYIIKYEYKYWQAENIKKEFEEIGTEVEILSVNSYRKIYY